MARVKQTIMQRNFVHMDVRKDALERDDTDLRQRSLKRGLNMKALATGAMEARPGTFFERQIGSSRQIVEIRPAAGLTYALLVNDTRLSVIDQNADNVHVKPSVPWSDGSKVWVAPFRDKIVMGTATEGMWVLTYDDGDWSFSDFEFADGVGGELNQAYWAYDTDHTIRPSAKTGEITIEASGPIWKNAYVGLRIRYGLREIEITEKVSKTVLKGNVINTLPPSFQITVADGSFYRVGEAVIGADTNFQGLVVGISENVLSVVTTDFFEGPDVGEELSSPSGSSAISAKVEVDPLDSPIWDEPLISALRGYPGSASRVAGRLVLLDFPSVPDLVALSSTRAVDDFGVGAEDSDAIVRQIGDGAPRWLHAVNMGDLLLFSDSGVYYVPTREGQLITPTTFNPVLVDETACNEIRPVRVEDGVVFVDAPGNGVAAVLLDGNVYLKWSVRRLTTLYDHLIDTPIALCGPAIGSSSAEKFLFAVNSDGTLAAITWQDSIRDEQIGFAPWETNGNFVFIAPIFNQYWAIVDRNLPGGTQRYLERFSNDAYLDCASASDVDDPVYLSINTGTLSVNGGPLNVRLATAHHIAGLTASCYANGWDAGDFLVPADGSVDLGVTFSGDRQIGLNFECEVEPWPVEVINSPRIGTLKARVMQLVVSVQDTLSYEATCNGVTRQVTSYQIGDDLSVPPDTRTEVGRFSVFGSRDHPEMTIAKRRPGPFRILAIGQRVQA